MAAHYSTGVLPERPRKPRDKAKVEAGVRFAQTYILRRLRAQNFFSLAECNEAIASVMRRMNERPMRHLGVSRRELFEKIERDALTPLPAEDWEFAEWRRAWVNLDYHIEVHDFLYSVPHALIRAEVEVRITERMVEVSIVASASPSTSAAPWVVGTARRLSTCRVRTGATPSGRRIGSAAGPGNRTEHGMPDRRRARQPAASRAGVPHMPWDSALLSRPRRRPR